MLLNDECSPTTDQVGFIELPVDKAADIVTKRWKRAVPLQVSHHSGPLREILYRLLPLTSLETRRRVFVQTASRWTAYFDNEWRGTDAFVVISNLAEHRCMGMKVVADPGSFAGERRPVDSPAVIWDVYGPDPNPILNYVRTISAVDEGGGHWEFHQSGEPFPFEDVSRYSAKRIRDRFPVELLLEYLRHFDIDLFNEEFYTGPATMIEFKSPTHPEMHEYPSFKAARENKPS
jgi:hypothetical protein